MSDGLYFLANDRVLNWAIAFFESVRAHEPAMRMVMIPFDQRIDELVKLADHYRFEIFDHPSLAELDAVGESFFPGKEVWQRTFRKFGVFWGPLDQFIFSDVDIVHLEGVRQYLDAFEKSGLDLLFSDEAIHQVYWGENLRRQMVESYGARGFNTGFWASRRGLFTLQRIKEIAEQARPVAADFNQGTYEQPFLNYCFDVSRLPYKQFAEVIPDLTRASLAEVRGVKRDARGVYRMADPRSSEYGKRFTFVHWAGTPATPVMPYRSIFLRYRLMREPSWRKMWLRLKGVPAVVFWNIVHAARNTNLISRTYKSLFPQRFQTRLSRRLHEK